MTDEKSEPPASSGENQPLLRLEVRLAQAEAQIRALTESLGEVHDHSRAQKQRAVTVRLILLVLALGALLFMKMRGS